MTSLNLLESLRVFRKVVDAGSFTRAARDLRLSVTWTSKTVERLETHLEVTLLQRTTRRLRLTDAGRHCYEAAGRMLEEAEDLEAGLGESTKVPKGRVRVSAPMSYAICELGPIIGEFCKINREIEVDLVLSDHFVDLIDEGFDLVVRLTTALPDSRLLMRKIGTERRIACAAPSYLAHHGSPKHPDDLRDHCCLIFSLLVQRNTWRFTQGDKEFDVPPRGRIVANNSLFLRTAILAGAGVALIPEFIVREDLRNGRIVPVLTEFTAQPLDLFLIRPADRRQPRRVSLLAEFLAARLSCVQAANADASGKSRKQARAAGAVQTAPGGR